MDMPAVGQVILMCFYGVIFTCKNVFPMAFLHAKKGGKVIAGGELSEIGLTEVFPVGFLREFCLFRAIL